MISEPRIKLQNGVMRLLLPLRIHEILNRVHKGFVKRP